MKKIKYETPNLRIKEYNYHLPKGEELDKLGIKLNLKRRWFGLESDYSFHERIKAVQVELMRKKS